jgi:S-adenosylmethionine hydrolase
LTVPGVTQTTDRLEGEVIYVDRFGNLTTNVDAGCLNHPVGRIRVGQVEIDGMSFFYDQVDEGQPLAHINSFGYLEIGINRGDAAKSLGIGKGEKVYVSWTS